MSNYEPDTGRAHYVGMAGLHGCLPQTCSVYDTEDEAVDGLAQIHELGRKRTVELRHNLTIKLSIKRDGNEYAEVVECGCEEPEVHND